MAKDCLGYDCHTVIADDREFCTTCECILADRLQKLEGDVDKLLRLEAQFVVWCRDNGHPHPHS